MPAIKRKLTPCLWFDSEAEEAAKFYSVPMPDKPPLFLLLAMTAQRD